MIFEMINQQILNKLINNWEYHTDKSERLSTHLYRQLKAVETTQWELSNLECHIMSELTAHQLNLENFEQARQTIQENCQHPSTTYHHQGDHDMPSYQTCDVCSHKF